MPMPIPSDWDGVTWCCHVIEWPSSQEWTAILSGFVTTPLRGRFWDGTTGSIIGAQAVGLQIFERNGDCLTMGCLEDLTNAINQISVTILNTIANSGGCDCSGTGGAGLYEAEPSTFEDDSDNFPSGYSDRAEYLDAKCRLAAFIIGRWSSDLARIRAIDAAGKTAQIVAALLPLAVLTPVGFVAVLAIAATILALVAISVSAFVASCNELITWLDGLDICLLYSASSAEDAKAAILADLDSQTFTEDALTKALFGYLVSFDALNVLFSENTTINVDELPDADCSACAEPGPCSAQFVMTYGTADQEPEFPGTYSSEIVGGFGYRYIQMDSGDPVDIAWGGTVGVTPDVTGDTYRMYSVGSPTPDIYSSDTEPSGTYLAVGSIIIASVGTDFTLELNCP